jgi:hypothetical protein
MTRVSFGKHVLKHKFMAALVYRLQRNNIESNMDNTKDASTNIQLLVIWRVEDNHELCASIMLIKDDNITTWNEDKLNELCDRHISLYGDDHSTEETWLLDDTTTLMTESKWGKEKQTIEITISEGIGKYGFMKPLCISLRT